MMLLDRGFRYIYKKFHGEKFYKCNWEIDLNGEVKDTTFVICDTETTGLDTKRDEPIAIGALKIKALHIDLSESFYRLIKPKKPPKRSAIEVHGITPSELTFADSHNVGREFLEFAWGSVLVGYFFPFDLSMIRKLLKNSCPTTFLPYFIDVLDLYRGERVSNMESLLSALGIPSSSHHSPLEDAYMTALIFLKLIKPYEKKKLKALPLRVL
ncbi:MAG: PolC-type DNA polymerase III [Hydrogenobacter sp.]